jgi:hypothetical protein
MLTLVIFLLSVYGLANAIAMLKIGVYFFGDPEDCVVLEGGKKIHWKKLFRTLDTLEIRDTMGIMHEVKKTDIARIFRRKGLGRIPYVGETFYCPACLSFWIGMAASVWIISPAAQVCQLWWKAMLLDGLMACGTSSLLHAVSMRMMSGIKEAS